MLSGSINPDPYCYSAFKSLFMATTIIQKDCFKDIPIATLYNIYKNAKEHSASVGVIAKIQNKQGAKFTAHNGYVTGKNLQLIKEKLIVQSWRASDWSKPDVESTFILRLEQMRHDSTITVVHAMLRINILQALRKAGRLLLETWKKYFAEKQKNKMTLSEPIQLVRLYYNLFNSKNQQLWKSSC